MSKKKPKYRSKFEQTVADQAKKDGLKVEYEPKERKLTWQPKQRTYLPDFSLGNVLVEVKGRLTASDRVKLSTVKLQHPEIVICLVFQQDNFLYKGSTTRYSEWAKKNGFPFSLKKIKKEWATW